MELMLGFYDSGQTTRLFCKKIKKKGSIWKLKTIIHSNSFKTDKIIQDDDSFKLIMVKRIVKLM